MHPPTPFVKEFIMKQEDVHNGSYGKWTRADGLKLREMFFEGKSHLEIAKTLNRTSGAIRAKCKKLGLQEGVRNPDDPVRFELPQSQEINQIHVQFSWSPVLNDDYSIYQFPQQLPSQLLEVARQGVYRWKAVAPDKGLIQYIGQSSDIFKKRIGRYLNPTHSETDRRINKELHALQKAGYHISLELLSYVVALPDGVILQEDNFCKSNSVFLESVLVSGHRCIENKLLNL